MSYYGKGDFFGDLWHAGETVAGLIPGVGGIIQTGMKLGEAGYNAIAGNGGGGSGAPPAVFDFALNALKAINPATSMAASRGMDPTQTVLGHPGQGAFTTMNQPSPRMVRRLRKGTYFGGKYYTRRQILRMNQAPEMNQVTTSVDPTVSPGYRPTVAPITSTAPMVGMTPPGVIHAMPATSIVNVDPLSPAGAMAHFAGAIGTRML
jgi:hypothetical protein